MKRNGWKIGIGIAVVAVLAFVFWWGGNAPGLRGWNPQPAGAVQDVSDAAHESLPEGEVQPAQQQERPGGDEPLTADEKVVLAEQIAAEEQAPVDTEAQPEGNSAGQEPEVQQPSVEEEPVQPLPEQSAAEEHPAPAEPETTAITNQAKTCTLSVRCDTVLQNMDWLDPEKAEIIPADGVIFPEKTVTFYEGESVYNVLLREMKQNKIHMEFTMTPLYNSAYIEGIGNLYEFDCGELSGWMYRVNGWYPNYGCSRYPVKKGDRIEVLYTCDLGVDIGGFYAFGKQ